MSRLPALMDRGMVASEVFGLPVAECRASVDAVFRQVPTVVIPGLRKPFVRRVDVEELLEALAKGREPVLEVEVAERVTVADGFDRYEASRLDWSPASRKVFDQAQARLGVLGRKVA